jgi:predicted dehydrogenase
MVNESRRNFVSKTLAASAIAGYVSSVEAREDMQAVALGLIGVGGMGSGHVKTICKRKDVQLKWVCDADSKRADTAAKTIFELTGQTAKVTQDLRVVLDSKETDAVIMATPDHWHAPGAILAAKAGKHVYVEKPCSHNLHEGRMMIEAARKNRVVMQVGTQSRSTENVIQVIERIRSGIIGEVKVAKAWNSQLRANQGRRSTSEAPRELDWDLWLGPVPAVPYKPTYHPAHWRWFFHFGSGDIGNDGVHDIDIARWGLGVESHPNRIIAQGSKLHFDDDQEWPDTLYCSFEYSMNGGKTKQLIYEQRDWSPYVQEGHENGCAWYGTDGMIVGGKARGWQIFGRKNKLIEDLPSPAGPDLAAHHQNFLDAIRKGSKANADIQINHLSTSLCHLANIACRTQSALEFDPETEQFLNADNKLQRMLTRTYRDHWAKPNV